MGLTYSPVPEIERRLSAAEWAAFLTMWERLHAKARRHAIRQHYYDGTNAFRDLGIAIPPQLRSVESVMGWPAKSVDHLERRVRLDGFVVPGYELSEFGLDQIIDENRLMVEAPQVHTSALIHAVAFLAVSRGDVAAGEPEVKISAFTATEATGLWLPAARRLGAGLVVLGRDDDSGNVTRLAIMFPHKVVYVWREHANGPWYVNDQPNALGYVPMFPVVYRPRLGRPFGHSRISRPVMNITDSAMRARLRAEVSAEFFSAPQRYLLGADEEQFIGADGRRRTTWDLLLGRLLTLPPSEDPTAPPPQIGQFPQQSPEPHNASMRMWASLFAAETGLAIGSLGVVQDNPSSAEAIYAAKEDLVIEAEATAATFGPAWEDALRAAAQIAAGSPEPIPALATLSSRWRDPSTPSRAQAVDAVTKEVAAGLLSPTSEVARRRAGYSETDIEVLEAEARRAGSSALIAALGERAPSPTEDAAALKAKAEALDALIRAGVDPESAAAQVGLAGLRFTGRTAEE